MSVSFTDGSEEKDPGEYLQYKSGIGKVYVPKRGVIVEEPIRVRYEKHPWIERFELDGVKPEPVRREGFGAKSVQGFFLSMPTVYESAVEDYLSYAEGAGADAGTADQMGAVDIMDGFFRYAADRMISESGSDPGQFSRFCGLVENMWRIGDEHAYSLAMNDIVPLIMKNDAVNSIFMSKITDEFKDALKADIKYMILGTGGTGGAVGSHLAKAGRDVTFIARGRHLEAMRENGLQVIKASDGFTVRNLKAYNENEFIEQLRNSGDEDQSVAPDVIFVCVKGYSIDDVIPFIRRVAASDTLVIPILNIYGTGRRMQEHLPGIMVTDGCIYVASEIRSPGTIFMNGEILRVVFGLRQEDSALEGNYKHLFDRIRDDLTDAGIECIVSDNIERDALRKFSYVSPQGACGLYYNIPAGPMQRPGKERERFAGLVREIQMLAEAMGIDFGEDIVPVNLKILDGLEPTMTTSLQRDIAAGKLSEIDGLIYEVIRKARQFGIELPLYEEAAERGLSGENIPCDMADEV